MFSRIRDHEEIAEKGEDPVTVNKARARGTFEDPDADLKENKNNSGRNGDDEHSAEAGMDIEGKCLLGEYFCIIFAGFLSVCAGTATNLI